MYSLEEKLNFNNQLSDFEKPVVRAFAVAGTFNKASDIKVILKDGFEECTIIVVKSDSKNISVSIILDIIEVQILRKSLMY